MNEQGSTTWRKERLGRCTASEFSKIMPGPKSQAYRSYAIQLRSELKLLSRINAGEDVRHIDVGGLTDQVGEKAVSISG